MRVERESLGKTTSALRGTTSEIERRAKQLRRQMTLAEDKLWRSLKGSGLDGFRFRSQHPVGVWILDFYCPALKLVIEVDGSSHDSKGEYDAIRTAHLESHGYSVLRMENEEVMNHFPEVLARISDFIRKLSAEKAKNT